MCVQADSGRSDWARPARQGRRAPFDRPRHSGTGLIRRLSAAATKDKPSERVKSGWNSTLALPSCPSAQAKGGADWNFRRSSRLVDSARLVSCARYDSQARWPVPIRTSPRDLGQPRHHPCRGCLSPANGRRLRLALRPRLAFPALNSKFRVHIGRSSRAPWVRRCSPSECRKPNRRRCPTIRPRRNHKHCI